MDIVEKLRLTCTGHPFAKIKWPHRVLHEAGEEITRLRAELAECMRDAERYRWLRGGKDVPLHSLRWPRWEVRRWNGRSWDSLVVDELDKLIESDMQSDDAAMGEVRSEARRADDGLDVGGWMEGVECMSISISVAYVAEIERLRHDIERHIAMASELATENERLRAELEMAYAEIRKQVAGSKVVFDRDLVNRAKDARPYNNHRIAWELERTAIGDGYYGNALRVAKDIPGLTPEDRSLLDRYATGSNAGTDHVALQALAMRIDALAAKEGE